MAIGISTDPATLTGLVVTIATQWRDAAGASQQLSAWLAKQGDDAAVAALFGIGPADVPALRSTIGYFATLAGVYHGTVQQGGTGGTGATLFNFDDALVIWAGP